MNTPATYLEQCKEAVASISIDELAERQVGGAIGYGSGFVTHRLGELSVGYVGAIATKLPKPGRTSWERILNEITDMQLLAGSNRELLSRLPAFLGLVTVGGHDVAVLTEDASNGGKTPVAERNLSPSTEANIKAQLPEGVSLNKSAKFYLSYQAGEEERLLDATPTPFVGRVPGRTELYYQVYDALSDLSLAVPPASPLGISLVSSRRPA